jgi:hypothetical protein
MVNVVDLHWAFAPGLRTLVDSAIMAVVNLHNVLK